MAPALIASAVLALESVLSTAITGMGAPSVFSLMTLQVSLRLINSMPCEYSTRSG